LFLEKRTKKSGLGTAYVHGFKWALAHIDFIFEMDADFSHNQNDLEKLYNACYLGDLAVGSRYVTGSKCGQLAIESCVVVVFCISICKFITGMKIHDASRIYLL
jgi:dolichol-phosphate mannosyltransferase